LSQVFLRIAQVFARGAATLSQQDKNNYVDVQRSRVNFSIVQRRIIRMRAILTAVSCNPAVVTAECCTATRYITFSPVSVPDYPQLFQRGSSQSPTHQITEFNVHTRNNFC
jgi:hypothetical protein